MEKICLDELEMVRGGWSVAVALAVGVVSGGANGASTGGSGLSLRFDGELNK